MPVFADNGAKALGQAEMWLGAGRGVSHAVVALWGTGRRRGHLHQWHALPRLGVQRRRVGPHQHHGRRQAVPLRRGRVCRGLRRGAGAAGGVVPHGPRRRAPSDPDSEEWVDRFLEAAAANKAAEAALDQAAFYVGIAAANLVNLFNPEKIIIGGWLGLQARARRCSPRSARRCRDQALEYTASRVSIEVGQLGAEAVALGACTLVVDELLANGGIPPVLGQSKFQQMRLP